jgi:TatD DNase family protein
MDLVDTHCHIQSIGLEVGERQTIALWQKSEFASDKVLKNAQDHGVTKLLCVGCDLEDSKLAINFAKSHPNCFASIGIHPHEAKQYADKPELLEEFKNLVAEDKVVAVGECGLDFYYNHSSKEDQLKMLKFQIELALEHDLPLIFHIREAFDDFWPVFDSFSGIKGVLHSFTDNMANLERAIQKGLYISVNGIATFTKDDQQKHVYKSIPLDHLLLETDSPFLTPEPYRGKINEPMRVGVIADFLSQLRNEKRENLASQTTKNAIELFRI